jgi:molybdate transport system substrate-binding protein
VLLASGKDNPAATALMQYLRSDKARVIKAYGYRF